MLKIIASFIVGFVFVMHAFGDFTAYADHHQGKEGLLMAGKHSVLPDEKRMVKKSLKDCKAPVILFTLYTEDIEYKLNQVRTQELIDEISKTAASRIIGIGGRKMAAAAAQKVVIRNGELAPTTTSSTNTGKDNEASKYNLRGRPYTKLNQKGEIKILKTAASSYTGSRRDEPRKHSHVDDETRRLLEAEREIVNLMHKDYKGSAGRSMGRRKPPINNHEPQH